MTIDVGGGALAGLSDVNLVSLSDGEILSYDAGSSKWVNASAGGGSAPPFTIANGDPLALNANADAVIGVDAGGSPFLQGYAGPADPQGNFTFDVGSGGAHIWAYAEGDIKSAQLDNLTGDGDQASGWALSGGSDDRGAELFAGAVVILNGGSSDSDIGGKAVLQGGASDSFVASHIDVDGSTPTESGSIAFFIGAVSTFSLSADTVSFNIPVISGSTFTATDFINTVGDFLAKSSAAFDDGAAAQLGTINNAPTAGNPSKWIPIDDNGVTRHVPVW